MVALLGADQWRGVRHYREAVILHGGRRGADGLPLGALERWGAIAGMRGMIAVASCNRDILICYCVDMTEAARLF